MKFEIKNRFTGSVLFSVETETLKLAVELGVKARANLAGANLDGAYLAGAYLAGAYLARANLDGANLAGANLDGANLDGANLDGANLAGAYLDGAYLAGAYLAGAYLAGAYLAGAYLDGAYLDGAGGKKLALTGERPVIQIGPLGSRGGYLLGYCTDAGLYVRAGCWFGSGEEFEARVREVYPTEVYGVEYLAALAFLRGHEERYRDESPREVAA